MLLTIDRKFSKKKFFFFGLKYRNKDIMLLNFYYFDLG